MASGKYEPAVADQWPSVIGHLFPFPTGHSRLPIPAAIGRLQRIVDTDRLLAFRTPGPMVRRHSAGNAERPRGAMQTNEVAGTAIEFDGGAMPRSIRRRIEGGPILPGDPV